MNFLSKAISRSGSMKTVSRLKIDAYDFSVQVVRVGEFTLGKRTVYPQHRGQFVIIVRCRSCRYSRGIGSKLVQDTSPSGKLKSFSSGEILPAIAEIQDSLSCSQADGTALSGVFRGSWRGRRLELGVKK